jgi:DNA-binding beta-propeller fold protein YncE
VSPDGRNVYVASVQSDAVAVFDRDPITGALEQKALTAGCVSETGTGGACADGSGLDGAIAVAVSPDGRNVYVASFGSNLIVVFDRNPATGALTETDSVSGTALLAPIALATSPDGRNVYVATLDGNAVVIFDRDPATGSLSQPSDPDGCVSADGTGGQCAEGVGLNDPRGLAVSKDGRHLYAVATGSNSLVIFDRDAATGALAHKGAADGCFSQTEPDCAEAAGLGSAFAVAVSGDGVSVYATGTSDDAIAVFDRKVTSGELSQKAGVSGCISELGAPCDDGKGLDFAAGVAVSPDSRRVYVAGFASDAIAIFDRDLPSYDIDGDGEIDALTDGPLLLRYMFSFTCPVLVANAVDLVNCTRCTAAEIEAYTRVAVGLLDPTLSQVPHRRDGLEVAVAVEEQQVVVERELRDAAGDRARDVLAAGPQIEVQARRLGPALGAQLDVVLRRQIAVEKVPLALVAAAGEQLELGEAAEDGRGAGERGLQGGTAPGVAQHRNPDRSVDEDDGDTSRRARRAERGRRLRAALQPRGQPRRRRRTRWSKPSLN